MKLVFVDPLPNKSVLQLHVIEQVQFLLNTKILEMQQFFKLILCIW